MTRLTEKQLRKLTGDTSHKYKAKQTEVDGIKFPSQAEANRYCNLKRLRQAGEDSWFIRQPTFDLPGGVRYRADFLIIWQSGEITVEDVKGFKTQAYKIKKKQVEALYPIRIEEVR